MSLCIRLLLVLLVITLSKISYAYSGAGAECGNDRLQIAAISGSSSELLAEIDLYIEKTINIVNDKKPIFIRAADRLWRETPRKEDLRKYFVNYWVGCHGLLLDHAVAAGNIENAKFLLSIGADPSGILDENYTFMRVIGGKRHDGSDFVAWNERDKINDSGSVFSRCLYLWGDKKSLREFSENARTKEDFEKIKSVYYFLLASGADVNAEFGFRTVRERGRFRTALHLCNDPDVIDFLLKNGANPDFGDGKNAGYKIRPFDLRVGQSLGPSSFVVENNFRISEIISKYAKNLSVSRHNEIGICMMCASGRDSERCKIISGFVRVGNPDIFLFQGDSGSRDSISVRSDRLRRCMSLVDSAVGR